MRSDECEYTLSCRTEDLPAVVAKLGEPDKSESLPDHPHTSIQDFLPVNFLPNALEELAHDGIWFFGWHSETSEYPPYHFYSDGREFYVFESGVDGGYVVDNVLDDGFVYNLEDLRDKLKWYNEAVFHVTDSRVEFLR